LLGNKKNSGVELGVGLLALCDYLLLHTAPNRLGRVDYYKIDYDLK